MNKRACPQKLGMAHLGSRGSKEKQKYEEGGKNKQMSENTRPKRKRPNGTIVCALLCGTGLWGWGGEDHPPITAHLWEARSVQEGFCSASAAGQQNWCSTVSFLRAEQRESVRAQHRFSVIKASSITH